MASNKRLIIGVVVIIILIVGAIFIFSDRGSTNSQNGNSNNLPPISQRTQIDPSNPPVWMTIELNDVNSGETFTFQEFQGKPVLLESFAVWCPTCTRQQQESKKFHDEVGDSVISISIDTDPNEDEERVRTHSQDNGFNWRYAVSPVSMTQSLIDEFGVRIINAPSVPMVLICEDGSFEILDSGVKKVPELKEAIASCSN